MRTKRQRVTVLVRTSTKIVHTWTDAKGVEWIFAQAVIRSTVEGKPVGGAVHPMLVCEADA